MNQYQRLSLEALEKIEIGKNAVTGSFLEGSEGEKDLRVLGDGRLTMCQEAQYHPGVD